MRHQPDSAWTRLSLSTRLNFIIGSILVVTMAAFVALDYARERKALLSAEADRLATLGVWAEDRLPARFSEITPEDLRAVASTSVERPVTLYLVRYGRMVLSSNERATELPVRKKATSSGSYELWWTSTGLAVSRPYRSSGNGVAAELFVEASFDSVTRVLRRTLRMHIIHGLATVLSMSLGVAWVLRRAVHRPFARMISAMNTMERGTWELDVPVSYRDEVGVLTSTFNRVGKKLTRTAHEFARTEKLGAIAFLAARMRRELDSPLAEIESAALRLRAPGLTTEHVKAEALRIRAASSFSRRALESLDDVFLAELNDRTESVGRESKAAG